MKSVDFLILAAVAALVLFAVFLNRRRKRTSSCCGDCSSCVKSVRVADRKKSDYPYEANASISGMTCQNCAVTVENALNSLPGTYATVRIDTKTARILSKFPPSESEIRSAVHRAGYGVESFEVKEP